MTLKSHSVRIDRWERWSMNDRTKAVLTLKKRSLIVIKIKYRVPLKVLAVLMRAKKWKFSHYVVVANKFSALSIMSRFSKLTMWFMDNTFSSSWLLLDSTTVFQRLFCEIHVFISDARFKPAENKNFPSNNSSCVGML